MKILFSALLVSLFAAAPSYAFEFRVVCSGSWTYGPNDGSSGQAMTPAAMAGDINNQLATIAQTRTILDVSAPMTSAGTGDGAAGNGDSHSYVQMVCVTVKLQ